MLRTNISSSSKARKINSGVKCNRKENRESKSSKPKKRKSRLKEKKDAKLLRNKFQRNYRAAGKPRKKLFTSLMLYLMTREKMLIKSQQRNKPEKKSQQKRKRRSSLPLAPLKKPFLNLATACESPKSKANWLWRACAEAEESPLTSSWPPFALDTSPTHTIRTIATHCTEPWATSGITATLIDTSQNIRS